MATKKAAKKSPTKKKYSLAASKQVQTELHEMHEGKLKSGGSGKKVTNPQTGHRHCSLRSPQEGRQGPTQPQ